MSRRSNPSSDPIKNRRKALNDQAAKLKAKLDQAQQFLEKAPVLKAEAQKREQQEILSTYRRAVRVEGPCDFRYELAGAKAGAKAAEASQGAEPAAAAHVGPSRRVRVCRHLRSPHALARVV